MAGAMSSDAIKGSDTPFDRRIQNVRGHGGQIAVAGVLLDATAFRTPIPFAASHKSQGRVSTFFAMFAEFSKLKPTPLPIIRLYLLIPGLSCRAAIFMLNRLRSRQTILLSRSRKSVHCRNAVSRYSLTPTLADCPRSLSRKAV
jgi:hypothetical protein